MRYRSKLFGNNGNNNKQCTNKGLNVIISRDLNEGGSHDRHRDPMTKIRSDEDALLWRQLGRLYRRDGQQRTNYSRLMLNVHTQLIAV